MTSQYAHYYVPALRQTARDWEQVEPLMRSSARDLGSASVAGVAPSVQAAATAFCQAWQGFAEESVAIVQGYGEQLSAFADDVAAVDNDVSADFKALDSRLGPRK